MGFKNNININNELLLYICFEDLNTWTLCCRWMLIGLWWLIGSHLYWFTVPTKSIQNWASALKQTHCTCLNASKSSMRYFVSGNVFHVLQHLCWHAKPPQSFVIDRLPCRRRRWAVRIIIIVYDAISTDYLKNFPIPV